MTDVPSRGRQTGAYLSPYSVQVSYGDRGAGIVRGTGADWFGPLNPIAPIAPPEIAGRQWDFPAGYNLSTARRQYEPITFETLRQFAQNCDILRLVIETRKDQFARQQWKIAPREDNKKTQDADVKMMTALFKRPDGLHTFPDWARMVLEDLFVIDAPALYCQRNRGGKLIALMPLDGATIKPVIDDWGRKPLPYTDEGGKLVTPVAYQQILKGFPAVDYSARDLIYRPRNLRATTPYGFGPVEQIFTTVNISLRHQLFQLTYYTEGSIPDALIGVPPTWTPDQIASFQRYFDDLYSGNLGNRRHAKFVSGEISKSLVQTKDPTLSGPFDEWLAKIICFAFSIPPNWFTKQMANRSGAETTKEAAEEEGLAPILQWTKQLIDDILECEFDLPGLEFVWQQEEAVDEQIQSTILIGYVGAGIQTRNEARDALGFDAIDDPAADKLMVTTGAGLMPLDANTIEGKQANIDAFGTSDGSMMPPEQAAEKGPKNGISGQKPQRYQGASGGREENGNGANKFAKRDVSDEARDDHGRWTSGGGSASGESEDDKRERQKANARVRAAASRARAKQLAREAARAQAPSPRDVARQTAQEEAADFKRTVNVLVRGIVLIAGAALVVELLPASATIAAIGTAAVVIGDRMLAEAAITTASHILDALGFEVAHSRLIIDSIQQFLGKSAGSAGDIQAIGELKAKLPLAVDTAVEMAIDYVAEHAPDAPLAAHNAIADALEGEADKFKARIAAMTAGDVGVAAKIAKGGKLTKAAISPVPHDRLPIRLARQAIAATMTAALAKVAKKAAAQVRARLKASAGEGRKVLGKGFNDDEPRDSLGRWTAYVVADTDPELDYGGSPSSFHAFRSRGNAENFAAVRRRRNESLNHGSNVTVHQVAVSGPSSSSIHIVHSISNQGALTIHSVSSEKEVSRAQQLSQLKERWDQEGREMDWEDVPVKEQTEFDAQWNKDHPTQQVNPDRYVFGSIPDYERAFEAKFLDGRTAPFPGLKRANEYFEEADKEQASYLSSVSLSAAKLLGKAEESPEDIADSVDFTDFEEVVPDIGDALAGVATDSARQTLVHIGVSDRADLMNQVNEGAVETARDRAAEMVGMRRLPDGTLAPSKNAKNTITETTRDAIRRIILSGLADNIGSDAISKNIEDAMAFSPERAELIAHTEVGNINSAASLDSAQAAADAGVEVLKGWLTAGDDKVEEICRANAAAGFIALDEDFPSGDAAPLAHPRCRCGIYYKVKEEA